MKDIGVAGVKVVNRYPENIPSLRSNILLYDIKNGNLKALLDSNYITTWRTACVAVITLKLLAVKNFKVVSLIGCGSVEIAFIKVLLNEYKDKEITLRIMDHKININKINETFKYCKNVNFELHSDYKKFVKDSDVVVSAVTYTEKDFADPSIYKRGVLVIPIHTRGFMECDLKFDKIYCDDINHVKNFKYYKQYKFIHEVSDVLNYNCKGRELDDERILVYNIGIALHDIALADEIYNKIYS